MTDAYKPGLSTWTLTVAQQAAVKAALATAKPWEVDNPDIAAVKAQIRVFHLARQSDTCCYCKESLHGHSPFKIDREHVLPKAKYTAFTYEIWNLSVSCKRCNLELKREGDTFVVNTTSSAPFQTSANYRIIHPNYDRWTKHLDRKMKQSNQAVMIKFRIKAGSAKGWYTYNFFRLNELEADTFDRGQGIVRLGLDGVGKLAERVRALARIYGQ